MVQPAVWRMGLQVLRSAWRRVQLSKGRTVHIEGRLQTREWEDRDGNKRTTTEVDALTVQFLGGPRGSGGQGSDHGGPSPGGSGYDSEASGPPPGGGYGPI
jgi:single-strand DNA-binding protein